MRLYLFYHLFVLQDIAVPSLVTNRAVFWCHELYGQLQGKTTTAEREIKKEEVFMNNQTKLCLKKIKILKNIRILEELKSLNNLNG